MTRVLEERGERVHPASRWLASESAHLESEAGEHDLNVFQAGRRMDEIMMANFMVFHDLIADRHQRWSADAPRRGAQSRQAGRGVTTPILVLQGWPGRAADFVPRPGPARHS